MKPLPLLACAALAAASLGAAVSPPPSPAAAPASVAAAGGTPPRAIAPEAIWDAGAVARGVKLVHEFQLRNEGTLPLFIREVRPSCGCTVVSYDATIAAGAAGKVRAELDTAAFRGAIAKEITVFTSDPANPALQLTVKADVEPPVDALPGYFRFVHVHGTASESMAQTLWSADRDDLQVLGVESPLPQVTVAFRPATEQERQPQGRGTQWTVAATIAADAPVGPLSGDVVIRTNHPRQPTLLVPIAGYVRPVLMVTPPTADFGHFPATAPRRGSVLIANYGAPVQLLSVDSDVRGLSSRIEVRQAGKRFAIDLELAAGVRGPIAGTLRVHTDSPQQPLLEIPVKGEAL